MGFYINTTSTGSSLGYDKARALVADGFKSITQPESFSEVPDDKGLVCVVDNGMFQAAGYAYDEREFQAFTGIDDRPKI